MVRTRDQKETQVGGNKTKTKEKQNIKKHKEKSVLILYRTVCLYSITAVKKTKQKNRIEKVK